MSFTIPNTSMIGDLLSDSSLASHFSEEENIKAILRFESCLAGAQAKIGMISDDDWEEIKSAIESFTPDLETLRESVNKNGIVVPGLLAALRGELSHSASNALHLGSTSQDAIDTSFMLRMKRVHEILCDRIRQFVSLLDELKSKHRQNSLMAYTRMQAALPSEVGERIGNWTEPLKKLGDQTLVFPLQLGGPIGSTSSFDGKRSELASIMCDHLGLDDIHRPWHTDRTYITDIGNWLVSVSGAVGKVGKDIGMMAQMGADHITLSSGGGSSSMPHKQNPVLAECLVSLAQYNATQHSGLHHALIHEQERSGSGWMLEWLILPQMALTSGASLKNATDLLNSIESIGKA